MRRVHHVDLGTVKGAIHLDSSVAEYRVRVYSSFEVREYFTDDLTDARHTLLLMMKEAL